MLWFFSGLLILFFIIMITVICCVLKFTKKLGIRIPILAGLIIIFFDFLFISVSLYRNFTLSNKIIIVLFLSGSFALIIVTIGTVFLLRIY